MSNNQLAGFPMLGPRVDTAIAYNPKSTTLETPLEIVASSYPETAQVQITVAAGDYPTFSTYPLDAYYKCSLIVCVQNSSGAARTVTAKYKTANTPTWSSNITSASIANGYNPSVELAGLTTFAAGDVQEVMLYASGSGVYITDYHLIIYCDLFNRTSPGFKPMMDFSAVIEGTSLVSGKTAIQANQLTMYPPDGKGGWTAIAYTPGTISYQAYCAAIVSSGKGMSVAGAKNAWTTPYTGNRIYQPYYPTRIAYTPIL